MLFCTLQVVKKLCSGACRSTPGTGGVARSPARHLPWLSGAGCEGCRLLVPCCEARGGRGVDTYAQDRPSELPTVEPESNALHICT